MHVVINEWCIMGLIPEDKKRRLFHQHCSTPQLSSALISAMGRSFHTQKPNLPIIWQWWQWSLCVESAKQKTRRVQKSWRLASFEARVRQLTLVEVHLQLRGNKKWERELLLLFSRAGQLAVLFQLTCSTPSGTGTAETPDPPTGVCSSRYDVLTSWQRRWLKIQPKMKTWTGKKVNKIAILRGGPLLCMQRFGLLTC